MIHESGIIPSNKQKGALRSCTNGRFLKAGKRNSLGGQWLEHSASATEGLGSIPSQGTKIPHASQCSQKSLKIRKERDKEVKMKKKKKHYYFRQDHLSLGEGLGFMMGITSLVLVRKFQADWF